MIRTAILGYGTVGRGVAEVLHTNAQSIARRTGEEICVKYVLDLREFPGDPVQEILVHDFETIVNDPEVRVVVETMGGLQPAYEFTKQALLAGKSVCTSNKELVARHGTELMQIAQEKNVRYLFEASCGGGIPIIRVLTDSLTADEIDEVTGILNGTTNYILTRMTEEGTDFADALAEAQALGYAERNPEADVEGHDAGRKIAILASIAYGSRVDHEDVRTEGITDITAADILYAKALGARIRLLATCRKTGNGAYALVAPVLIRPDSPLYIVNGVYNAVFVHGKMLGDAMFYGSGAGSLPTASAVAADVIDCVRHPGSDRAVLWGEEKQTVLPAGEMESRFLIRVEGDADVRRKEITARFGDVETVTVSGVSGEFGFLTGPLRGTECSALLAETEGVIGKRRVFFK